MKAYGKLNLTLDVLGKRDDGYHDIVSVMQSVSLCDEIRIITDRSEWSVQSENQDLPLGDSNLALKAAKVFCRKAGIDQPMRIVIDKNIPIFAGLGGGSADAAAVLLELNSIYGGRYDMDELVSMALEIGSDVPFFLYGGTCRVSGRGEYVEPVSSFPDCWFVICKPPVDLGAGQMYNLLDNCVITNRPDTDAFLSAVNCGDIQKACGMMANVFEPLAAELCSDIPVIKKELLDNGAIAASMTGKGPSVFAIFVDEALALNAYTELKKTYPKTYLAKNV